MIIFLSKAFKYDIGNNKQMYDTYHKYTIYVSIIAGGTL